MFTCVQVTVLALCQNDLLLVVPQLQGRRIASALEVFGANLSGEDTGLRPVLGLNAKADLIQNEFCLFLPVH